MNNIIFDGNYLFYKTLFIFRAEGGKKVLEPKRQQEDFIRKVATDMAYAIRQFGAPQRIIFTIDGRSWRKDVEIEENAGYKSNRSKDSNIDWDSFFKCMNEFADILKDQGIIVSRIDRAEGDDLMYLWTQLLLSQGQNSIVITGDKDLLQVVRNSSKGGYAVVYNPNSKSRRIYGHDGLIEWLKKDDTVDLFDTSSFIKTGKDLINHALKNIPLTEMDPLNFLKIKVLKGDDGDGVPSIFHWKSKNGKTTNRITDKRAQAIIEHINENLGSDDWNVFKYPEIAGAVCKGIKAVTKQDSDPEVIKDKLSRNITLMVLHKNTIPGDILSGFQAHVNETINNTLPGRKYDVSVLLEGTRFLKPPDSFQTGLFGALDKKK